LVGLKGHQSVALKGLKTAETSAACWAERWATQTDYPMAARTDGLLAECWVLARAVRWGEWTVDWMVWYSVAMKAVRSAPRWAGSTVSKKAGAWAARSARCWVDWRAHLTVVRSDYLWAARWGTPRAALKVLTKAAHSALRKAVTKVSTKVALWANKTAERLE